METNDKKPWTAPELTQYGSVEVMTQEFKLKQPGSSDDFNVPGICDP
jgi:hypothetical protein